MNCRLCLCSLEGLKSYKLCDNVAVEESLRPIMEIIDKYLEIEFTPCSNNNCICVECYKHLEDFHRFVILIQTKQKAWQALTKQKSKTKAQQKQKNKLENLEEGKEDGGVYDDDFMNEHEIEHKDYYHNDNDDDHEMKYIKDTDVIVEFKACGNDDDDDDDNDEIKQNTDPELDADPEDLLTQINCISNMFTDNSSNSTSFPNFEHVTWFESHDHIKMTTPSKAVRKTPYKTHTPEDRARIVAAANRGDDWSALATALGVKYKTAYTWVSTSRKEMFLKNGKKSKPFTEDEMSTIINWIEENRQTTLKDLVAKVKAHMKREEGVYLIEGSLEGRLYRLKDPNYNSLIINTMENKRKRAEFVNSLKYYMHSNKTVIWVGETCYKMFCRRAKGRFNTNSIVTAYDPSIYLIGAISKAGLIAIKRSRDQPVPETVLHNSKTLSDNPADTVIVCDSELSFSALDEKFTDSNVTLLLLSPYSPMLNPMDAIWSKIRSSLATPPLMPTESFADLKEQRLTDLEKSIDHAITLISDEDCIRAINDTIVYHKDALTMKDITAAI